MSQCYQVALKSSVSRIVKGEDSISYPIELTQILPPEEMSDILLASLQADGWEEVAGNEKVLTKKGPAGETLTIDLENMELTASIAEEREVVAEVIAEGMSGTKESARSEAQALLKEEEEVMGDKLEDQGNKDLQTEVTAKLAESESARQRQINEILQEVYAEALKKKAGQLGEVMEISESTNEDGNYELTIRIEQ